MTDLFVPGRFLSHSGLPLEGKIECDALSDDEIAWFAERAVRLWPPPYRVVVGVPRGGLRLAVAIQKITIPRSIGRALIVDDVFTTGASMGRERAIYSGAVGVVMFARGPCPVWVKPIFTLNTDLPLKAAGALE